MKLLSKLPVCLVAISLVHLCKISRIEVCIRLLSFICFKTYVVLFLHISFRWWMHLWLSDHFPTCLTEEVTLIPACPNIACKSMANWISFVSELKIDFSVDISVLLRFCYRLTIIKFYLFLINIFPSVRFHFPLM